MWWGTGRVSVCGDDQNGSKQRGDTRRVVWSQVLQVSIINKSKIFIFVYKKRYKIKFPRPSTPARQFCHARLDEPEYGLPVQGCADVRHHETRRDRAVLRENLRRRLRQKSLHGQTSSVRRQVEGDWFLKKKKKTIKFQNNS